MPSFWRQTWLILRNDIRLSWRQISLGAFRNLARGGILAAFFVVLQGMFIMIFWAKHQAPPLVGEAVAWSLVGIVMLSGAIRSAVTLLYERADFDLLLPSPVSAGAILLARLAAITVSAAAVVLLFLLPMLNAAVLILSPTYLFGYAVWLLVATSFACAGVAITLALGRWLGPHRAKTWGNVIGIAVGMGAYVIAQLPALLGGRHRTAGATAFRAVFGNPVLLGLANAGHGHWLPLLVLVGIAAASVGLTILLLARRFVVGLQHAQALGSTLARSRAYRFSGGLFMVAIRKDLRLIVRDPVLLVRILPMALVCVPIYILGTRAFHVDIAALLSMCVVGGTVIFSSIFTMLAVAAEVGWDLIRLSPASGASMRIAKIGAGFAVPGTLCFLGVVGIVLLGRPLLALLTLVDALTASLALCWIEVAAMKPVPRRDLVQGAQFVAPPQTASIERLASSLVLSFGSIATIALTAFGWKAFAALGFLILAITAVASFALVEMRDLEFEPAATRPLASLPPR